MSSELTAGYYEDLIKHIHIQQLCLSTQGIGKYVYRFVLMYL